MIQRTSRVAALPSVGVASLALLFLGVPGCKPVANSPQTGPEKTQSRGSGSRSVGIPPREAGADSRSETKPETNPGAKPGTSPEESPSRTFTDADQAREAYLALSPEERQTRMRDTARKRGEALIDLREAKLHMRAGEPQLALEARDSSIELIPGDARAWSLKAEVYRQIGEYEAALAVLREMLERFPPQQHHDYYGDMARIEIARKDPGAALEILAKPLQVEQGVPGLRLLRAECLALRGDTEGALVAVEDTIGNGYLNAKKLRQNENLASLREEPRFEALVRGLEERMNKNHARARASLAAEKAEQDAQKRESSAAEQR